MAISTQYIPPLYPIIHKPAPLLQWHDWRLPPRFLLSVDHAALPSSPSKSSNNPTAQNTHNYKTPPAMRLFRAVHRFPTLKSLVNKNPPLVLLNYAPLSKSLLNPIARFLVMKKSAHNLSTAAAFVDQPYKDKRKSNQLLWKEKKAARRDWESPSGQLLKKLISCAKVKNVEEAVRLFDEALANDVYLEVEHFDKLLYLCSSSSDGWILDKGFDIYKQMSLKGISPTEATFTNTARLAAAKEDHDLAFDLVKKMKSCGLSPKLRSYLPALFGFCKNRLAEKAYEVDAYMVENGILPEESELTALLKVSSDEKHEEKVYEMMHRLRATMRQVSEETAVIMEDWFLSEKAGEVGENKWDVGKVKEGVVKGGGGWHGQGWLGSGKWQVVRTEMDKIGVCQSCGEKLVSIDIDPRETENFASSLSTLACEKEVKANFLQFEEWLRKHGPFDAVVDGANVGLVNQRSFNFLQLKSVVNSLRNMSPSKRLPLVVLHRNRVTSGPAQEPMNKRLLEFWKQSGALYATPQGSHDEWYWLYAAVSSKCLLVTNDEMRDHLFQLLGTSFFPRWKDRHQVRTSVSREGVKLHMPPPYSIVIQESEGGSWHIPTVTGDDFQTRRKWICATRTSEDLSRI